MNVKAIAIDVMMTLLYVLNVILHSQAIIFMKGNVEHAQLSNTTLILRAKHARVVTKPALNVMVQMTMTALVVIQAQFSLAVFVRKIVGLAMLRLLLMYVKSVYPQHVVHVMLIESLV